MPLTPSQKSAAFRQRRAEKMARMEAALVWIVDYSNDAHIVARARNALNPGKEMGE